MPLAYDGLRILDFSQIIAGPACTNFFTMHGAHVIKIESPTTGDQFRTIIKTGAYDTYGMSPSFMSLNTGKKSLAIDLKHPKAKEIIFKLIETSDVIVENFRAGVIDKLGFGYEVVCAVKPDIVYCSVSGYGQEGPRSNAPAYDGAVQADSGMMTVTGHPATGPTRTGYTVVDLSTAMSAAFALATAIHRKSQTGLGQRLDVAMMDTAMWMMGPLVVSHMIGGEDFGLKGNDSPALTPTGNVFPASDGFIQITGMTEQHAASMVEALELGDRNDPRLANIQAMRDNHDEVRDLFAERMRLKPLAHWLETFEALKVPHAPIRDIPTVLGDPQLEHRGILMDAPVPTGTAPEAGASVKLVGQAYIANEDGPATMGPPPVLGEHTDTVLAEVGYTADDIAAFRNEGVFG